MFQSKTMKMYPTIQVQSVRLKISKRRCHRISVIDYEYDDGDDGRVKEESLEECIQD